jgi:PhnB protein
MMNGMRTINSYLTFNGNCREAMMFYKECLGGELSLQTVGESPLSGKMPAKMKSCILHASLVNGSLVLMGSDMVADTGLIKGNAVSLVLQCRSKRDIHACYAALSAGGRATHPIEKTFWGALFGGLTDKYGNHWLLNYEKQEE